MIENETVWGYLNRLSEAAEESAASSSSWLSSSASSSAESVNWVLKERGGLAKIAGLVVVPSQFLGPDLATCRKLIEREAVESIVIEGNGVEIHGVILYPPNFDKSNKTKCILYNNPNAITVPEYFFYGFDRNSPPYHILRNNQCPIIMYDYRGTGLSREENTSIPTMPSANTITIDGNTALAYAMSRFDHVDVWGSSLGGGVATVACGNYINEFPDQANRITLYNHDSFTTTGKVKLHKSIASLASTVGANLDAETPMYELAAHKVKIVILCHMNDPVIKAGARMSEIVPKLKGDVTLILSDREGHANLSSDMLRKLNYK